MHTQSAAWVLLLLAAPLFAQQGEPLQGDREAIRKVLAELNRHRVRHQPRAFAAHFTRDGIFSSGCGDALTGPAAIAAAVDDPGLFSETTLPFLTDIRIRLVAAGAAQVEANETRYGSLIGKSSVPVVLRMEKVAGEWRVASYRTECGCLGPAPCGAGPLGCPDYLAGLGRGVASPGMSPITHFTCSMHIF